MASIFSRIIKGEIPAYKVAENESCMAFLDINPLAKGHVLVIPKQEVEELFDLEDDLYISLQTFARKVAIGLKKAVPCNRIGVTVIGLEVPHAHIHLIPINGMNDMNFSKPKLRLSHEELLELADRISQKIAL